MGKHTKRPWLFKQSILKTGLINSKVFDIWSSHAHNEKHIATIHEHVNFKSDEANARLIAAAPELLEALEHVVAYMKKYKPESCGIDDDRDCSPYNDAIQAIAKAEGRGES